MSSSKNLEYERTSFLNKSNSAFIERMYLKFVKKDADLPDSWRDYFEGIESNRELIALVIYRELLDDLYKKDERGL